MTPLVPFTQLFDNACGEVPLGFVKDESCRAVNPTGTIKDRRIASILASNRARLEDGAIACCITSGNVGLSLVHALAAESDEALRRTKVTILLEDTAESRKTLGPRLESVNTRLIFESFEEVITYERFKRLVTEIWSRRHQDLVDFSDSFYPQFANVAIPARGAYETLAEEIIQQTAALLPSALKDPPVVVVPVGCGDLITSLSRWFIARRWAHRLIGVCVEGENLIPLALQNNSSEICLPRTRPHGLARGLATPVSGLVDELISLFQMPNNSLATVNNDELTHIWNTEAWAQFFEPTSLPGAMIACRLLADSPGTPLVLVNTGRSVMFTPPPPRDFQEVCRAT